MDTASFGFTCLVSISPFFPSYLWRNFLPFRWSQNLLQEDVSSNHLFSVAWPSHSRKLNLGTLSGLWEKVKLSFLWTDVYRRLQACAARPTRWGGRDLRQSQPRRDKGCETEGEMLTAREGFRKNSHIQPWLKLAQLTGLCSVSIIYSFYFFN